MKEFRELKGQGWWWRIQSEQEGDSSADELMMMLNSSAEVANSHPQNADPKHRSIKSEWQPLNQQHLSLRHCKTKALHPKVKN